MIAFIFPGQGSQTVGMAADLYEATGPARTLLDEMAAAVDFPLLELMFAGPAAALTQTEHAQPALLAHSAAANLLLRQAGLEPEVVAGHSLGEYSALVAAECLSPVAAMRLVAQRGEFMAQAAREVGGTMAAVLGLEASVLRETLAPAREVGVVSLANLNSPAQVVISGEQAAVQRAAELALAAGAKRVLPLKVSGAFHSPLMQPAAEKLRASLRDCPLADARVPVISNIDARPRTDADEIRAALVAQLTSAVQWTKTIARLLKMGVTDFVEVGPGNVLAKMLKRSVPQARVHRAGTRQDITDTLAALKP